MEALNTTFTRRLPTPYTAGYWYGCGRAEKKLRRSQRLQRS
jgi:hypothetical protein